MRITHRLLWLTGYVAVSAASSVRVLANATRYPWPALTAFASDVPLEVLKARSQYDIVAAASEQVSSVCFCVLPCVW